MAAIQLTLVVVICLIAAAFGQISPDFPTKVLVQAATQSVKSNVIVSPYSLLAPLGTLALASVYSTRGELLDLLGVEDNDNITDAYTDYKAKLGKLENTELLSANKLYISNLFKINHKFNTLVQEIFDVDVQSIDFWDVAATKAEVSNWIRNQTNDNMYWSLKPTTLYEAAIVNAILLNAKWAEKFAYVPGSREFYMNENNTFNVYYMNKVFGSYHANSEDLHAQVFQIPYEDNECKFVGVVPYAMNSLEGVLEALAKNGNLINKVLDTEMSFKRINLTMPLFDVFSTIDVEQLLENLGVQTLFHHAQLYHLLEGERYILVNEAHQKVAITVDVEGTQIVTANVDVVWQPFFSLTPPDVDVVVDHPFYFEIRCSDITLINGVVRKPMTRLKYKKLNL